MSARRHHGPSTGDPPSQDRSDPASPAPDRARTKTAALRRRALLWALSLLGGALLLWLASLRIELLPDTLTVPRPGLLALGVALYLPYTAVRALRLRYALDPLVRKDSHPDRDRDRDRDGDGDDGGDGDGDGKNNGKNNGKGNDNGKGTGEGEDDDTRRGVPRALIYGSGWLSFLIILLLPLRLGELSRPALLSRPRLPGLGFAEALSAVATERAVDGLLVVGLLFLGLACSEELTHEATGNLAYIQTFGRAMGVLFVFALVMLVLAARAPARVAGALGHVARALGFERLIGPLPLARVLAVVERLAAAIRPLGRREQGVPFLLGSALYWGLTVAQLWLVLHACGLELGFAAAATVVAVVGLSIQLPGGPAQVGSFQAGTALGLGLFVDEVALAGPGSSFTAIMYLLGLAGAAVFAIPGAWLLTRVSSTR